MRRFVFFGLFLAFSGVSTAQADGWQFGPSLLIGAPHPLNLSFEIKPGMGSRWSLALTGGGLSVPVSGITVGITNVDVRGRWHPFSGSFFLGAIVGTQTISGKGSDQIAITGVGTVPVTADVSIKSTYVSPHLGWLWIWGSGFMLGFELGWQIPFAPSSNFNINIDDATYNAYLDQVKTTPQYQQLQNNIQDQANRVGTISFPYATLLRLGWMF